MRTAVTFDARLYQVALLLFPPAFRRQFSGEMLRDFEEGRDEACLDGRAELWHFRAHIVLDLVRALGRQWLRDGWPLILLSAVAGPMATSYAVLQLFGQPGFRMQFDGADAELLAIELIVCVVLLIIMSTLVFSLWLSQLMRRPTRRTPFSRSA
jgi:hypothetical protein